MKVLVADDQPEYYAALRRQLERDRPQDVIVFVSDGSEAYRALSDSAERPFSLLILDEQMGGGERDGSALLRRLRDEPLEHQPSIIYVTGYFNEIPADRILQSGTSVALFLDKNAASDTLLFRAVLIVAGQSEGPHYHPREFFGRSFVDMVTAEVERILESPHDCFLSLTQQRVIGSLMRSFFTTLEMRRAWSAEDVLELAVFFAEGICRVYDLPDDIVRLVRRFLDVEDILYTIPRYRDHFLHQIKVFLLGFCILCWLSRNGRLRATHLGRSNAMKLWFLASVFHDIGYPFEKMRAWMEAYVMGVLRSPAEEGSDGSLVPMLVNWGALFGRRYHWYHLERIADTICKYYGPTEVRTRAEVVVGLAEHVAEKPDHGLYSSLIVQNFLRVRLQDEEVDPVAAAIALHSTSISKVVRGALGGGQLMFVRDQLSFLLAFCDTAQEWGRAEARLRDVRSVLSELCVFDALEFSDSREVTVELRFPRRRDVREINDWKRRVFEKELLSLREVWTSGGDLSFAIAYFHGESRQRREPLDVLTL